MKISTYTIVCLAAIYCTSANAQSTYIDKYITESINLTTIASDAQNISQPRDLDFKPNSNELWVVNKGQGDGGSMVIIYNAGMPQQSDERRKDTHTGHFKIFPSAFAFGQDGFFANTNEIKSTAGPDATFMGPALWSSDTAIFARVFQNDWESGLPLGSHYDMLHQSPFSMGIAHDTAMAYWVNDGYNGNICKYDFVKHHGPGYDNHSAGKIWRYTDVKVSRVPNVPSHMILDKASGWLYYIDGGSKTIKRLDTKSGAITGNLTPPSSGGETLAGYWKVTGAMVETLDTFDTQPCGIDLQDNRLIVSDYTTGDIYLYSLNPVLTLLKTIQTGHPGLMGVKFGPDSKIWTVNFTENKVYRLDISAPENDIALISIEGPGTQPFMPNFYLTTNNVCETAIAPSVNVLNKATIDIKSIDFKYSLDSGVPISFNWGGTINPGQSASITLPATELTNGPHMLNIRAELVNASPDDVTLNNSISGSFRAIVPVQDTAFSQDFDTSIFPPDGWNYIGFNPNNLMSVFAAGGFGNSSNSLKMDNFSGNENISGQVDYFMSPAIDCSNSEKLVLSFSVAYAQYDATTKDKLQVLISTDCGNSWTNAYDKQGSELKTAPAATSSWSPSAAQWRAESISLTPYAGESSVIVMFAATSNFGNNLYIDDINLESTLGNVDLNVQNNLFKVYPNPTTGIIELLVDEQLTKSNINGKVFSNDGKLIQTFSIPQSQTSKQLNLTEFPGGIYQILLSNDHIQVSKSVIKK